MTSKRKIFASEAEKCALLQSNAHLPLPHNTTGMKILITGAAGSGTSTLANAIAEATQTHALETDDYFWRPTNPPYQVKFEPEERCARLLKDLRARPETVVAGAVMAWGEALEHAFDLVVFLYVPTPIRLARLKLREERRFGKADPDFLEWAAQYDAGTAEGRSLEKHRQWLQNLRCPVLYLEGDGTVEARLQSVLAARNAIIEGAGPE